MLPKKFQRSDWGTRYLRLASWLFIAGMVALWVTGLERNTFSKAPVTQVRKVATVVCVISSIPNEQTSNMDAASTRK